MIDLEDTIPTENEQNDFLPTAEVIKALDILSKDDKNAVYVVSNNKKDKVHRWFAEKAASLGIAAEGGFFWRQNSIKKTDIEWNRLVKNA